MELTQSSHRAHITEQDRIGQRWQGTTMSIEYGLLTSLAYWQDRTQSSCAKSIDVGDAVRLCFTLIIQGYEGTRGIALYTRVREDSLIYEGRSFCWIDIYIDSAFVTPNHPTVAMTIAMTVTMTITAPRPSHESRPQVTIHLRITATITADTVEHSDCDCSRI